MLTRTLILALVFCICFLPAPAQNSHPYFRNYTTDHGLPSQEVHCILQDSEGYMWFGTDNGVSRFDGYTFRNFGLREGLLDVVVFEMLEDRRGRVWMNTMGGNLYYFEQDSIYAYQYNDTIQQYRDSYVLAKRFYIDKEETVYTCLWDLGILKIAKDGKHQLFQNESQFGKLVIEPEGFFLYSSTAPEDLVLKDSLSRLLNLQNRVSNVEFLRDEGRIRIGDFEMFKKTGGFNGIFSLGKNRHLLSQNYGIYFINHYRLTWQRPFGFEVTSILMDGDDSFFLTLNRGGGMRKYGSTEALKDGQYEQYLDGYSVTRAFKDRDGGYWIATLENGVFYTSDFSMLIYDEKSGLSNSFVSAVEPKGHEGIFIGLRDGKLYRIPFLQSGLESLPPKTNAGPVYDLWYDHKEEVLWIGSVGLDYYEEGEMHLLSFWYEELKKWSSITFKRINPVAQKLRLWGASNRGIGLIDLNTRKYQVASNYAYGSNLFKARVFVVLEDFNEKVWLGMEKGLYDWNDGNPIPVSIEHPAFRVRVEDLAQLPDSTIVIGTKGQGVALWKGDDIQQFTTTEGLTSDMIENVHVDEQGNIWVGTLNGLNRLHHNDSGQWEIKQITIAHGLPSNSINMVKTVGQDVWVATDRGLVHFLDIRQPNAVSLAPIIGQVLVNGTLTGSTSSVYPYSQNNFVLHFLTIDYRQNGRIPYRYRLGPAHDNWIPTQNTSVNFSTLSGGDYAFEVQSQNEDGIWSESATYEFRIRLPWWETWWAISLTALALAAAAFGVYKYRTMQLKREISLQKQLAKVERQALRSQMNPHFIFNSLNAIQGYIAHGDKQSANRYLSRFAKLIRAALQHSRLTKVPLEDDLRSLRNYLELEQLRFQGSFDFQIYVAENIAIADMTIPPMLVQPFVENAIVHGLANKKGKGQIMLDYQLSDGLLQVTVTDNGIGIEASKKQKAGLESSHKSVGMTVTARRLEMLNESGRAGKMKTKELKDENGQITGTQVKIWVPVVRL